MKKIAVFFSGLALSVGLALFAQNGGGHNGGGGGGGGSPGGSTNAVQYNAGGSFGGISVGADQLLQGTASSPQATSVPNCVAAQALTYSTSTHLFTCVGVATSTSGTFTGTFAAGCTTTPTATFNYQIDGNTVTIGLIGAGLVCTSNAATFQITGLPGAAIPAHLHMVQVAELEDNGTVEVGGVLRVNADGSFSLNKSVTSTSIVTTTSGVGTGWTTTGTKGIQTGFVSTYPLF